MKGYILLCCLFLVFVLGNVESHEDEYHPREVSSNALPMLHEDKEYWIKDAQALLDRQLSIRLRVKQAKNVIMFLGDGMSLSTVTAARILKGSKTGLWEREKMAWEAFDFSALSKTYNTMKQVTDSAASATAYINGVKTNTGVIGIDVNSIRTNCSTQLDESIYTSSIAQWFQEAGRSSGFVTSTRVTHATPAGTYAHIAERDWEDDQKVVDDKEDPEICDDIAEQLVFREPGKNLKVIMGGGRGRFITKDELDVEDGIPGHRGDGKNLIDSWLADKAARGVSASYVWNKEQLHSVNVKETDYVLGLFGYDHLDTVMTRNTEMDPSLPEMTKAAIEILSKDENGYFLLVEGGRIDHMHHDNKVHQSLEETLDFEKAVAMGIEITDPEETLILVTADHGHTLTINGYANRNSDILGYSGTSDIDHEKYTSLNYGSGPGFRVTDDGKRYEPTLEDIDNMDYPYSSAMPLESSSHDGTDVGMWADGPFAHLFTGIYEENYVPHALAYAACVGNGRTFCDEQKRP